MTVRSLYPEQFEELREKLFRAFDEDTLEATGADLDAWNDEDIEAWRNDNISDDLVIKSFEMYDFVCDDFWTTARQYDKYPERE